MLNGVRRVFAREIKNIPHPDDQQTMCYGGVILTLKAFKTYLNQVISDHMKLWDEALLSAAIWFVRHELGLSTLYIHDFDSGNRLKAIAGRLPPRSLYTDLPKKFCFEQIDHAPLFLAAQPSKALKTLTKAGQVRFWKLAP